jgi:hypothetical protein
MDVGKLKTHELETQGYTVLESCIDVKCVENATREILAQYEASRPLPWKGGGQWFGHLSYTPSPTSEIVRQLASNLVIQEVLDCAMAKDYKVIGFGGNANLPGSRHQPPHVDGWLGTHFLIVNLPLGKVTERNGSTEVWPGTHREDLTISQFNSKPRQSVRINSAPGDVVLRYSNLWHRGTPNRSGDVRLMLAMIVSRQYRQLPEWKVSQEEREHLSTFRLPVNAATGSELKRGFGTSYFPATLKGNILELTWMYAPGVFNVIRHFKKSSI